MKKAFSFLASLFYCMGLFLVFPQDAFAQEGSCAEKLRTAQSLFERGQVNQVPELLNECLKKGFSREESLIAYKLIIQSYLFEEKQEEYDSTMYEFLRKNPEYELSPTDHSRFIYLYNNFRVKPVIKLAVHLGLNMPFVTAVDNKSITGDQSYGSYSSGLNIYLSFLEAKYELTRRIELNAEVAYSGLTLTNTRTFYSIGVSAYNMGVTTYTEQQNRLEIPVTATMNLANYRKMTFFGRAGAGPAFTLSVKASADFRPSDVNGIPLNVSGLDRSSSRIPVDIFAQLGGGIKYKTRNGFFVAEVRSNLGLLDQTRGNNQDFASDKLARNFYYTDDDFNLNSLNFNVGYTYIFYKPSKIR
ncbi:MAG TPA: outer membrane beta-barrel protein [Bacteroidales bacterium]|nr:outer membrane beta-barrel protein [Bacteroidales bacterium]